MMLGQCVNVNTVTSVVFNQGSVSASQVANKKYI